MKKVLAILLTLVMIFCFAGCGEKTSSGGKKSSEKKEVSFDIKDLEWTVEEGIKDGNRIVFFHLTNNSKYVVTKFEISYIQKSGLAEDQIEAYYATAQKQLDIDDEEMSEIREEEPEIVLHAETYNIIEPGQTEATGRGYYSTGIFYCNDVSAFDLVDPDIATIEYIDGDVIKKAYYDFKSKKLTVDSETEVAYQWPKSKPATSLPKPDAKVVEVSIDRDDTVWIDVYGMNNDKYQAYVDACKEAGFNKEITSFDTSFYADNDAGDSISISLNEDSFKMDVHVDAADSDEEEIEEVEEG